MNLVYFITFLIYIINCITNVNSREKYIDISDMTDERILNNRHRHSSNLDNRKVYKEIKITYEIKKGDSLDEQKYDPKNPFPNTDSCLDESLQLEDANKIEDSSGCKTNKLNDNEIQLIECDQDASCGIDDDEGYRFNYAKYEKLRDEKMRNDKMLQNCVIKNKGLTEDLVCYRNLQSLYSRYSLGIKHIISSMQDNNQKIEIHPYSNEFFVLIKALDRENCLSAVDDLEQIVSRLDRLLYRIEAIDWSKELIYVAILLSILFCFYYIYRYLNFKTLFCSLLFFLAYAHEYYYLLLAKKADMAHQLRKYPSCQETGVFTGLVSYFFAGFYTPFSFKSDKCEINEDYLYIDAAFKINPLLPVFSIIPKLISRFFVIIFENGGLAFKLFASQLPFFHVYPMLILFLALLLFIIKLLIDWRIESKKIEQQYKFRLAELSNENQKLMIKDKNRLPSLESKQSEANRSSDQSATTSLRRARSLDFIPNF